MDVVRRLLEPDDTIGTSTRLVLELELLKSRLRSGCFLVGGTGEEAYIVVPVVIRTGDTFCGD